MTPIIIPIHTRSQPVEDPTCPHCQQKLPGWSRPQKGSLNFFLMGVIILLIFSLQLMMTGLGFIDGTFANSSSTQACGPYFTKRWHFVFPLYQVSCRTSMWLRNQPESSHD